MIVVKNKKMCWKHKIVGINFVQLKICMIKFLYKTYFVQLYVKNKKMSNYKIVEGLIKWYKYNVYIDFNYKSSF